MYDLKIVSSVWFFDRFDFGMISVELAELEVFLTMAKWPMIMPIAKATATVRAARIAEI